MSSIKWGIVSAGAALIISITLGIVFGVNPARIFLRGLVFMVVFFGLGIGVRIMLNNYFPDLLYLGEESGREITFEQPGSRINITLGGMSEYAVPETYKESEDSQEMGNIEDLISGSFRVRSEGIDRRREEDYNDQRGDAAEDQEDIRFNDPMPSETVSFKKPVFTPSFVDGSDGLEGLPDLGSMAMAFSTEGESSGSGSMPFGFGEDLSFGDDVAPERQPINEGARTQYRKGNKPQSLQGDFNPKDLAEGIRTVLSMDKG